MPEDLDLNVLRDVLALLHPDMLSERRGVFGQNENKERLARIEAFLINLQESLSSKDAPWDLDDGGRGSASVSILPKFISLLREFMLTHRWPQVMKILDCLAHVPEGADWVVWKASLTVLYTEPEVNCELIQQFFKQMYLLRELNIRGVVLEFVLFLLTQGLTQEATQVIQHSHKIRRGLRSQQQADHTQHLCDLLDAYQGVIFYVEWRQAVHRASTASLGVSLSESFYDLMQPNEGLSEDAIKQIAARALLALDLLPDKGGVWDIFLPKAIEIHEYYEELEKARDLLDKYRKRNPGNPNSHRFLYEFLKRNEQRFEYEREKVQTDMISCLKDVARLDPSNPHVLTLCDRLADTGQSEAVSYMFDLLDFNIWKDKPDGWNWLSDYLQKLLTRNGSSANKSCVEALERCWSCRKDWWPSYHFSSALCRDCPESRDLLVAKCVVASVLLGKDCKFCEQARPFINKKRSQQLDKVLSNMNLELLRDEEAHSASKQPRISDDQSDPDLRVLETSVGHA